MPTYDYRCDDCGDFAVMRPMARRDEAARCPGCGASAPCACGGRARAGQHERRDAPCARAQRAQRQRAQGKRAARTGLRLLRAGEAGGARGGRQAGGLAALDDQPLSATAGVRRHRPEPREGALHDALGAQRRELLRADLQVVPQHFLGMLAQRRRRMAQRRRRVGQAQRAGGADHPAMPSDAGGRAPGSAPARCAGRGGAPADRRRPGDVVDRAARYRLGLQQRDPLRRGRPRVTSIISGSASAVGHAASIGGEALVLRPVHFGGLAEARELAVVADRQQHCRRRWGSPGRAPRWMDIARAAARCRH